MFDPQLSEPKLLKAILEPLLEDFEYWLERSRQLLETEEIPFLSNLEQTELLARVQTATQEVKATKTLFQATAGQVGVETTVLAPWHQLLMECWQISIRFRQQEHSQTEE